MRATPFEDVWFRRQDVDYEVGRSIAVPAYDDLILTKLFAARPKDLIDIDFIRALKASKERAP